MPKLRPGLVLALALLVGACSIYRIDVQQGNVLSDDAIASLKVGMTKRQVRFLLGSPPISDPFHNDRWDYVYYLRKHGKPDPHERRLTLTFQGDTLAHIDSNLPPAQLPDVERKG